MYAIYTAVMTSDVQRNERNIQCYVGTFVYSPNNEALLNYLYIKLKQL